MKNVYCAHPFKKSREGNDCVIYDCPICGSHWAIGWRGEDEPKVIIGYVED